MEDDKITMGAFSLDDPIILIPHPNGGWTIEQGSGDGVMPQKIGAYTNTDDMLDALNKNLPHAPS